MDENGEDCEICKYYHKNPTEMPCDDCIHIYRRDSPERKKHKSHFKPISVSKAKLAEILGMSPDDEGLWFLDTKDINKIIRTVAMENIKKGML